MKDVAFPFWIGDKVWIVVKECDYCNRYQAYEGIIQRVTGIFILAGFRGQDGKHEIDYQVAYEDDGDISVKTMPRVFSTEDDAKTEMMIRENQSREGL